MKIRAGFISNSSTCSFVAIGYRKKITDDIMQHFIEFVKSKFNFVPNEEYCDTLQEKFYECMSQTNNYIYQDEDGPVLGICLVQMGSEEPFFEYLEVELRDFKPDIEEAFGVKMDEEPKLIMGSYSC